MTSRPPCASGLLSLFPDLLILESLTSNLLDGGKHTGAIFSPPDASGYSTHRYLLWRIWDDTQPYLLALMLNPSTADDIDNDATVERMMQRAIAMGYGGIIVTNVFAWRDKSPAAMKKAADPIGQANNDAIRLAAAGAGLIICGWGSHGGYLDRANAVSRLLMASGHSLTALKVLGDGQPGHPLYLPYRLLPQPWQPPEASNGS